MEISSKSEEELQKENVLPEGEYDALVVFAEEKTSKSGKDMIALQFEVVDPDQPSSPPKIVRDYVSEYWMAYKLRHLFCACGLEEVYESGSVSAALLVGCNVRIALKHGMPEAGSGYGISMKVRDYHPVLPATREPNGGDMPDDFLS